MAIVGLPRDILKLVLIAVSAFLLWMAWAIATPVGSSADETFHLTSIWCSTPRSADCERLPESGAVIVPKDVGRTPCFVGKPEVSALCPDDTLLPAWAETSHLNQGTWGYPPIFHTTMAIFVGPDISRSVVSMRVTNAAIAAVVLFWAMTISSPSVRRGLALGWGAAMVPFVLFYVPSANPTSWAIVGVGTFWAFTYATLDARSGSFQRSAAGAGMAVSAALSLARADMLWPLLLSAVAVFILHGWLRRRPWTTVLLTISAVLLGAAVALQFNIGRYLNSLTWAWPTGNSLEDQPNPVIKVLSEFPAFLAGHVGLQTPWAMRESISDFGVDGWVNRTFLYGVGSPDIELPSLVGVGGVVVVAALLMTGFSTYSCRRLLAMVILLGGLLAQVLAMRGLGGWGSWTTAQGFAWFIYPRYTLPILIVALSIGTLVRSTDRSLLNALQWKVLSSILVITSSIALMSVLARYMHGQDHSWVQFEPSHGWWWSWGPDPLVVLGIGLAAALTLFPTLLSFGVDSSRCEPRARRGDSSCHTA